MTKAQVKATIISSFVGKSAKEVRELALTGRADRAEALAYASAKVAELASHKFRGQLWAQTVKALSGKPAKAPAMSKADILAQLAILQAQLTATA